jgi:hypothetical protein
MAKKMEVIRFVPIGGIPHSKNFTLSIPIHKPNPEYNPMIDITLVTLTGKIIPLTISKYDTVDRLKKRMYSIENLLIDTQQYVFNGKSLDDVNTLDHYGITSGSRVHLRLRLRGGMFHPTSSRSDWVSINFINKLQTGLAMIHHMKSHGVGIDTLNELQCVLEKCSTDKEIDTIFALIEKYYVE